MGTNMLLVFFSILIIGCVILFWWNTLPGGKYIRMAGVITISATFIYGAIWFVNKAKANSSGIDIEKFNTRER
jgi:energy-coupling factor transporter transmembrane protein EcfT